MVALPIFDVRRWRMAFTIAVPLFWAWTAALIGLRAEHLLVGAFFLVAFWSGRPRLAHFAASVLPFLLVGVAYDNLRLVLDLRGEIHVADLYYAELRWFGIDGPDGRQILPTYFASHPNVWLDFVCGLAYIMYLLEVFGAAILLYLRHPGSLGALAWGWLLVNILGMITYIVYPAAPPWYVADYGLGPAILDAAPSAAGAARFDALIGVDLFASFYARNANVFGAMPSLHCAYPTLVALTTWHLGARWRAFTVPFAVLVWFSAVYLGHHYVLDVLAGIAYGIASAIMMSAITRWRARRRTGNNPGVSDVGPSVRS